MLFGRNHDYLILCIYSLTTQAIILVHLVLQVEQNITEMNCTLDLIKILKVIKFISKENRQTDLKCILNMILFILWWMIIHIWNPNLERTIFRWIQQSNDLEISKKLYGEVQRSLNKIMTWHNPIVTNIKISVAWLFVKRLHPHLTFIKLSC